MTNPKTGGQAGHYEFRQSACIVGSGVNGAVQREYTYGLQRISQNQVVNNAWTQSFYGYDGMGNVRQLTNPAGVITDKYDYDAFGNLVNSTGTTPNNYRYRGEQYDSDLGLYYLRARYYNPATGRFLSRDPEDGKPIDPKTLHKYLYAGGDPVDGRDPTGRAELFENALLDDTILPELREVTSRLAFKGALLICKALFQNGDPRQIGIYHPELAPLLNDIALFCANIM